MWGLWDPMNSKHNPGVCRPSVFLPIGQSPRPAQPSTSGKPPMPHRPRYNQFNKPKWLVNRFFKCTREQQVHKVSSYTDKRVQHSRRSFSCNNQRTHELATLFLFLVSFVNIGKYSCVIVIVFIFISW